MQPWMYAAIFVAVLLGIGLTVDRVQRRRRGGLDAVDSPDAGRSVYQTAAELQNQDTVAAQRAANWGNQMLNGPG